MVGAPHMFPVVTILTASLPTSDIQSAGPRVAAGLLEPEPPAQLSFLFIDSEAAALPGALRGTPAQNQTGLLRTSCPRVFPSLWVTHLPLGDGTSQPELSLCLVWPSRVAGLPGRPLGGRGGAASSCPG